MGIMLQGKVVIAGEASGKLLVSAEPLSFWGGYDANTGEIIDRRHSLAGSIAAGCILAIPFTRGSSTTTAVLLEAIKAGTAPAAIITTEPDSFFALASIVADEMYNAPLPLAVLSAADFAQLKSGANASLSADGQLSITVQLLNSFAS